MIRLYKMLEHEQVTDVDTLLYKWRSLPDEAKQDIVDVIVHVAEYRKENNKIDEEDLLTIEGVIDELTDFANDISSRVRATRRAIDARKKTLTPNPERNFHQCRGQLNKARTN